MNTERFLVETGGLAKFQFIAIALMAYSKVLCGLLVLLPIYINYSQPLLCALNDSSTTNSSHMTVNSRYCKLADLAVNCSSVRFSDSPFSETVPNRYGLHCEYSNYPAYASSACMGGIFVGSLVLGHFSDLWGRLPVLSAASGFSSLATVVGAFAPQFWLHGLARFCVGVGVAGLFSPSNSYMIEVLPVKGRLPLSLVAMGGFNVGALLCCVLAYLIRNSVHLQLTAAAFTLPGVFYVLLLPESFKWLIALGRAPQALRSILHIARVNGVKVDKDSTSQSVCDVIDMIKNRNARKTPETFKDIVRYRRMLWYLVIFSVLFFFTALIFYGLSLGSGKFSTNIFIGTFGVAFSTVLTRVFLVLVSVYLGRVLVLTALYAGTSLLLIVGSVLKWQLVSPVAQLVCLTGATMLVESAFSWIWIFAGEVFPSGIRTHCVSLCSAAARIGGILAMLCLLLSPEGLYALCGVLSVIAFVLVAVKLPETRGQPIFDNLQEAQARLRPRENWLLHYFRAPTSDNQGNSEEQTQLETNL